MRPFQKSRRIDTRLKQFAARSLRAVGSGISPDRGLLKPFLMPCPFLWGGTRVAPSDAYPHASLDAPMDALSDAPSDARERVVLEAAQLPAGPLFALARGSNLVSIPCQPSQAEQI